MVEINMKIFSKEFIEKMLQLGTSKHSQNFEVPWNYDRKKPFNVKDSTWYEKFLEMRRLVDRWGHHTTDIIIPMKFKNSFEEEMKGKEHFLSHEDYDEIMGIRVNYSKFISDKFLLALDYNFIAQGPTDIDGNGNVQDLLNALFGEDNEEDIKFVSTAISVISLNENSRIKNLVDKVISKFQ